MKKCNHCGLSVRTDRATCPLCLNLLTEDDGAAEELSYPHRKARPIDRKNFYYRAMIFLSVGASLITLLINLLTRKEGGSFWCAYVALGAFYAFMLFRTAVLTRTRVIQKITVQLICACILLWGINFFASPTVDWALGYAIPMLCVGMNTVSLILALARRNSYRESFGAFFLSQLIGMVPFVLSLAGVDAFRGIPVLWAPLASMCVSLLVILQAFTISWKTTKEELKKRFHV